jgi:hypothetical protein
MKRLLLLLLLALIGCGGTVTFSGDTLPNNAVTVSGFVSIVQLTAVNDGNGTLINVTVVTLALQGTAQTLTFCGTQSNLFPINQNVRATFVPGANCSNIVAVVDF